jgi:hypothetical protein
MDGGIGVDGSGQSIRGRGRGEVEVMKADALPLRVGVRVLFVGVPAQRVVQDIFG